MSRWRAVVFDLDDTLYPERDYVRSGFRAAAAWCGAELGVSPEEALAEMWRRFEGGARGDVFDRWLESHGLDLEPNREAMIRAYRDHTPDVKLYPDVRPVLARLRGRFRLGLITEGFGAVQRSKIDSLGLASEFERVVVLGEDERQFWKPSPEPFHRWRGGVEVEPDQALYVGDNPAKDFLGARRAGWASVRLRRADGLHRSREPETAEAAPDFEIDSLEALLPLLGIDSA
jgi:putative hydrolase of the HAD superfamily